MLAGGDRAARFDGDASASTLLARARFVVVGAGGLGCPALLGLVDAGARHLTIVDDDQVDASNLQRQVLFDTADVGARKTDAARWSLGRRVLAPLAVETVTRRLDPDDPARLDALVRGPGDAESRPACVLECSDDPRLKFAIHDACFAAGIPVVVAGVIGWRGQVMAVDPSRRDLPCYRCLFESPPPRELAPACVAVGVIGAVAGFIGHAMAMLAVGLATGSREAAGALLHFDLLAGGIRRLAPAPRRDCRGCGGARNMPVAQP
jgi:molybdopterin/thiamine biosynthesis adenylyltransferase